MGQAQKLENESLRFSYFPPILLKPHFQLLVNKTGIIPWITNITKTRLRAINFLTRGTSGRRILGDK